MSNAVKPLEINLVIPMAGRGTRFRKGGYQTYKPFIPILGKPMVQHVIDAFPLTIRRFVITSKELLSPDEAHFLENDLGCEIIFIPPHSEGPAYSIYAARDQLPLDGSFFVSYCDIFWKWDFAKVMEDLEFSGAVFTHQGFHPHLINDNYSAFCKSDPEDPTQLLEIREKGSFTDDWMNEQVSIGLFFVRRGHDLLQACGNLIKGEKRVSGEFFPSLIFNEILSSGGRVALRPVDFYVHWGVPAQLHDIEHWRDVVNAEFKPVSVTVDNLDLPENVICMAGLGSRMHRVSTEQKAFIPVNGRPMYAFVSEKFSSISTTIITVDEIATKLKNSYDFSGEIVKLPHQTHSQYETLLLAAPALKIRKNFFLTSCDCYGFFDVEKFLHLIGGCRPDGVIFTFKPSLTQRKLSAHHTHVTVEKDRVTAVHLKSKSKEDDLGLAGFFWLSDGSLFDRLPDLPLWTEGEMMIDNVFKYFVDTGLNIMPYLLDQYLHLGTADEYLEHKFWFERRQILMAP